MPDMRKTLLIRGIKALGILGTVLQFGACWQIAYASPSAHGLLISVFIYTVLIVLLNRIYNAFAVGMARVSELVYSLCLADIIADGIMYAVACIACGRIANPLPLAALLLVQLLWNALWAVSANKVYFRIHKPRITAVIYRSEADLKKLSEINFFVNKFNVQKYICQPEDIHSLIAELDGVQAVFVVGIDATLRNGIAKFCVERGVHGYFLPHVGDVLMAGAAHMQMFSVPVMRIQRTALTPEYRFMKRAMDIICSALGLIVASPVLLIVALLIKLYDGGPVFYRQVRLTRDGKPFNILKFRSMRQDAEKDGVARLAGQDDDRITPVGRWIRACRIDELPQLINILKGDMTIVGPRPERPEIAAQYEKELPAFQLRLQVKAGLTGLAQVYGRYNTEPREKLIMDLMYINEMSFMEDIRLILATIKILFIKESTQGVQEWQTTGLTTEKTEHPSKERSKTA